MFTITGCSDNQSIALKNTPVSVSGTGQVSTTTRAPSTLTPHPTMVPTPTSIHLDSAILGGNIQAFIQKYGQPNGHSQTQAGFYDFQQYPGENTDFLIISTDVADGVPYENTVLDIKVQSPNNSGFQNEEMCKVFYPLDATYQRQVTIIGGIDKIYFSASLAKMLPASSFTDATQNQVTPGYFDITYLINADGTISSCDISPGTQGTA